MLNGIDPIIIFNFKNKGILDFFGSNSLLSNFITEQFGVPIPIYLSEKVTGIYVDNEARSIDAHTKVEPITEKDPITGQVKQPLVTQTAIDTQTTVNLLASRDSILLTALLALMSQIVDRLVSGEYSIHYINGPTVIFGGLLSRFSTSVSRNDDLVRIDFTLSTAAKENPTPVSQALPIPGVTGTIPL